jgi:hypothetical protein
VTPGTAPYLDLPASGMACNGTWAAAMNPPVNARVKDTFDVDTSQALGYFKWPDPSYWCKGVVRLLGSLEQSAAQLDARVHPSRCLTCVGCGRYPSTRARVRA